MGFNNIQTFPRTSKSVGVYNKPGVSQTTISLEVLMPQDLYRVYALFTRINITFSDTAAASSVQKFSQVSVTDGASWNRTLDLSGKAATAHTLEWELDLTPLLNPTGRNIITFTFAAGAYPNGGSFTCNLWKADMLYSTIGNR